MTRVLQLVIVGSELVRKVCEGTRWLEQVVKDGIDDGLFAKLTLVVKIVSVKGAGQLGTIVWMGVTGWPDRVVTRSSATISLIQLRQ
jgi:hypothetical protein